MKKALLFFITILLSSNIVLADYVYHSCERKRIDTLGFRDQAAAESWYPKRLSITTNTETKIASMYNNDVDLFIRGDKRRMEARFPRIMTGGYKKIYTVYFLPNGEVHTELSDSAGYQKAGGAVYICSGWDKK